MRYAFGVKCTLRISRSDEKEEINLKRNDNSTTPLMNYRGENHRMTQLQTGNINYVGRRKVNVSGICIRKARAVKTTFVPFGLVCVSLLYI